MPNPLPFRFFLLLVTFFGLAPALSQATHIVGGNFEMEHVRGNTYTFRLILFFDQVNGDPGAEDEEVMMHVYSKSTDNGVAWARLQRVSNDEFVPNINEECGSSNLQTRIIVYERDLEMDPEFFDDPQGYYMVWERCCRNETIENIEDPGATGQAFYAEFPPIQRNGSAFRDDLPQFEQALNDFVCEGETFSFDFGATDADGDNLRYSIVAPKAGHSSDAPSRIAPYHLTERVANNFGDPFPNYLPAPYESVDWRPGFSTANQIPGNPPLRIDENTGELTMEPSVTGLMVFAIKVEEFRNGQKIGEVQREFQINIKNCVENNPPAIQTVNRQGESGTIGEGDTLVMPQGQNCAEVKVTDVLGRDQVSQELSASVRAIDFNPNQVTVNTTGEFINTSNDTMRSQICIDPCVSSDREATVVELEYTVEDEGCPRPKTDQTRFFVEFPPLQNQPPVTTFSGLPPDDTVRFFPGDSVSFQVTAMDPEATNISLRAEGEGFVLNGAGMNFSSRSSNDQVTSTFEWASDCNNPPGDTFKVLFLANDFICPDTKFDTSEVVFVQDKRLNEPPQISAEAPQGNFFATAADTIFLRDAGNLTFDLTTTDAEGDPLEIELIGLNFDTDEVGMSFNGTAGSSPLQSEFSWSSFCGLAQEQDTFEVRFVAKDQVCDLSETDTLDRVFILEPVGNDAPQISLTKTGEGRGGTDTVEVFTAADLEYLVSVQDPEGDSVFLEMVPEGFSLEQVDAQMSAAEGLGSASSTFSYAVACFTSFPNDTLDFRFTARDNYCIRTNRDTLRLTVILNDSLNNPPSIRVGEAQGATISGDTLIIDDERPVSVPIFGQDTIDQDSLTLSAFGSDFPLEEFGMVMPETRGQETVTGTFEWDAFCDLAEIRDTFTVFFVVESRFCLLPKYDTAKLVIKLEEGDNRPPQVDVLDSLGNRGGSRQQRVVAGETVKFQLWGFDPDAGDELNVRLNVEGFTQEELGMLFDESETGNGQITIPFEWPTNCSHLDEGTYFLEFIISDQFCPVTQYDTLQLSIEVFDFTTKLDSLYNVVTPNGDGKNDRFFLGNVLPRDHCGSEFKHIEVFDRWGKEVFFSRDRDFRWDPLEDSKGAGVLHERLSPGVYFYYVKFTGGESFKGWVHVLY